MARNKVRLMETPRVVDNDCDEITATLDGKEIRGWSYANEAERRVKMLAAREFCEGWFLANARTLAIIDEEYDEAPSGSYDNGGTMDGWRMACRRLEERLKPRTARTGADK